MASEAAEIIAPPLHFTPCPSPARRAGLLFDGATWRDKTQFHKTEKRDGQEGVSALRGSNGNCLTKRSFSETP